MKNKRSWLTTLALITLNATVAVIALSTFSAPKAIAGGQKMYCRDCPFPSKVSDGRWLMPNGILQLEIDEQPLPNHMNQIDFKLRDVRTGSVVATGVVIQRKYRQTISVDLMDREGRAIKGFVRYVDHDRDTIQAKFTCEECLIEPMLD